MQLLEIDYPHARKVKLLCDNLNTHHIASLYEAFSAPEAHRLARRLELYFTPRNGSWLNITEIETQCFTSTMPQAPNGGCSNIGKRISCLATTT